jgi:hypothetical protein
MTVTVQRNAPCPCGSGKKYKKCCINKENVVQLQQVKEERYFQAKHVLTEKLRDFIDSKLSYNQSQRLFNEFRNRTEREIAEKAEQSVFDFWLFHFHRFENGLRGLEWFEKEQASRLSTQERILLKRLVSLQPRLVEATGKTEETITFTDVITKETFPVPYPAEPLHTFAPWYGTFGLLDSFGDQYVFHGVNILVSPESIQTAKRKIEEVLAKAGDLKELLMDHYPEILAKLLTEKFPGGPDQAVKDVSIYQVQAGVLDDYQVASSFYEVDELAIDEWSQERKSAGWAENWKVYRDTEIDEDILLAEAKGHLLIEDNQLTFKCYSEKVRDIFLERLKDLHLSITNIEQKTETVTIPFNAELQNTMIKLGEGTPPYAALYVQAVGLIDIDQKIPKYDHLSLRELVENNREGDAEVWLKQNEYYVYKEAEYRYEDITFTADFNTVRKALGLPLSPFVTGGVKRASSVRATESIIEKPPIVTEVEIVIFEALGFRPETIQTFYTNDLVDFYKEKANGKGENTVRKYRNSLFMIREALENSMYESWRQVDIEFWETLIVFDFPDLNGPTSKTQMKDFLSTVKMFTKWLEKRKKQKGVKEVAAFISEVEDELLDGAELLFQFNPRYRYMNEVDEKFAELAKILRGVGGEYNELIEGTFQVEKKNKGTIRLIDLEDKVKPMTVKMSAKLLDFVHEGMIFDAEIGRKTGSTNVLVDINQIFSKKARQYFDFILR